MQQLNGVIRHYPWGSRTMLADLRGAPSPSERPEAEIWFGAHPAAPATVDGRPLDEVIAEDPLAALGARVRARFGDRLPFLVKLLAAGEPLSLQAHPSLTQAREGFERENSLGVGIGAPDRNYRDDSHKPEIVVALTDFSALSGFRPIPQTRELFAVLGCSALDHYGSILGSDLEKDLEKGAQPPASEGENGNLRALFTTWITIPAISRRALIDEIIAAARPHLKRGDWISDALNVVVALNERYPGDVGVLGALLLNHVNLLPGESIHTPAGNLHAYIHGLGVEVMASSDNVLRGGLTSKYVDVPELVRVLQFTETADPRVARGEDGSFLDPAEEYSVRGHDIAAGEALLVDEDGPAIILCTAGEVYGDDMCVSAGGALWIPASDPAVSLSASGAGAQIFVVTV